METGPIVAAISIQDRHQPRRRYISRTVAGFWALTKPDVNFLIAITVIAGFCLAGPISLQSFRYALLIQTLLGTLLVAGGAGTLNQVVEKRFDAQMRRTSRRPLVAGGISSLAALWFGIALVCGGSVYLAVAVNWLSALIAVLTLGSYLAIYTPLKRKTWYCTLIGALPGAAPPLIGWAAASGTLSLMAWTLYAILFLWQFPHFMAIAWMYREDYDRAGYLVLPPGQRRSRFLAWQCILPTCLLIPLSLTPALAGHAGLPYSAAALFLGVSFLYAGVRLVRSNSNAAARQLLTASIFYAPSIFLLMVLDKS
jgi:protoheme IX farnesyltransferase